MHDRLSYIHDASAAAFRIDTDEGGSFVHAPSKSETLFAKSDELSVTFYANLPVEVKQVLKNAGELDVMGCVACTVD